jgi:hypothetical protein
VFFGFVFPSWIFFLFFYFFIRVVDVNGFFILYAMASIVYFFKIYVASGGSSMGKGLCSLDRTRPN